MLSVNPRGSTSYGEQFANLINHAYPGQDYDDLMSAVDGAIAQGFADGDHLYVTGGSGGGVLTAWIVGKTNRFRAAVTQKPVIDWASFALTADAPAFFSRYWFGHYPWRIRRASGRARLSLVATSDPDDGGGGGELSHPGERGRAILAGCSFWEFDRAPRTWRRARVASRLSSRQGAGHPRLVRMLSKECHWRHSYGKLATRRTSAKGSQARAGVEPPSARAHILGDMGAAFLRLRCRSRPRG